MEISEIVAYLGNSGDGNSGSLSGIDELYFGCGVGSSIQESK
jgi:hypothetical protein